MTLPVFSLILIATNSYPGCCFFSGKIYSNGCYVAVTTSIIITLLENNVITVRVLVPQERVILVMFPRLEKKKTHRENKTFLHTVFTKATICNNMKNLAIYCIH